MEESEDNISSEDMKGMASPSVKSKPKKRSLVERELETNLTERITSPIVSDSPNTSRYGRARRFKTESELNDTQKVGKPLKSPQNDKSAMKSPVYKMHASNSPIRVESPTKIAIEATIDHQIENIYNENISLSRFGSEKKHVSPIKEKVYVRKDLIQSKEKDEDVTLIKNIFSPVKSNQKSNNHLNNVLERSADKFSLSYNRPNGYLGNSSVVKTLDFDGKKKKVSDSKVLSKSDLFELEAKCEYQVGDLAWAKMGTYPFWPCIVTRDPYSGMFVKKKLFGRVDRDVIHVTFFGDNGRRSWIVDNMLRNFRGQLEFEAVREKFTPEVRKKDPRCAAFFVSDKKLPQWTVSVEEAEALLREPKRLRIDLLNDMLNKAKAGKTTPKGSRKVSRTDSDVSLSESLYDTLFSEDDSKTTEGTEVNARKKSLDVSDVVTACLDNMAAKTGITKIQKQSHMDRWLQKAKSKTPEKSQRKSQKMGQPIVVRKRNNKDKKDQDPKKPFRFASDNESLSDVENKLKPHQNEHDYSTRVSHENGMVNPESPGFGAITKVECLSDNDVSSNLLDSELILSDECAVGEETVVESDDIVMGSNEISDIMMSEVKTIQDDAISIITISSTLSKNDGGQIDDDYETSVSGSESRATSTSNDINKAEKDIVSAKLDSDNGILSDSDNCNTERSDTNKSMLGVNFLGDEDNTDSTNESVSQLTNGHDTETNSDEDLLKNCEKVHKFVANEEPHENSMEWSAKTNIISEDDQEKQDVNIAKTILNDKLVGNTVDSNKTDFINEVNEMSIDENVTLNDDSDLTISETNGHNRSLSDDAINNDVETESSMNKDKFYLEMNENNNSTDSSQYNVTAKTVYNTCSDVYYRDNTQTDSSKADENEVLSNGFTYNSTELMEIESIRRNSDSSSFFGDDERSTNSTPNNLKEFSTVNKSKKNKLKLIRRVHARLRNSQNNEHNDQPLDDSPEPVNVHNTLKDDSVIPNGEMVDSVSQQQSSADSSTLESERCSVESKETSDSENKSLYNDNDEQTESTETTGTIDDDESTTDSVIQNGYHEPSKDFRDHCFDSNITASHADLSKEKAIINGDELRLTPNGFQIIKENVQEYSEIAENKEDAKDSDTVSVSSMGSEESMASDVITQNGHLEPSESNLVIAVETNKSSLPVEFNKDEAIMNGDELTLTENGLEINNEICATKEINNEDDTKKNEEINSVKIEDIHDTKKDEEIISVKIEDKDADAASIISTDSEVSLSKRRMRWKVEKQGIAEKKTAIAKNMEDPEFLKYLELKQDDIFDEHPEFTQDEITTYLFNTWLYEQSLKTDTKKIDDIESANMVKGLQSEPVQKEARKRVKVKKEKDYDPIKDETVVPKQKPKRRTVRPSYNEEYSDIESDLEVFTIFKPKRKEIQIKTEDVSGIAEGVETSEVVEIFEEEEIDEVEEYFARLAEPKPNVFKGLLRERVCEMCEKTGNLVKCKGCSCMFHVNCVMKNTEVVEVQAPTKGRKKKKKHKSRKSKSDENLDDSIDDKDANASEELANSSLEAIEQEPHIVANVDDFESKLELKMKELLGDNDTIHYESPSSGDELDWSDTEPGKCEVIDIKLRIKSDELPDYSDFKCNNCQMYDVPICFVCRSAESPKNSALHRQRCQVAQCNKYYHLECLEHWPQTQFNSGECARYNKKINEYFEALTCPRHVCHTCVSDDPRGCKTRFSGDKLAKCVRCPATYHSFTRCLPAGSQILTGSHIICPRHYEHRPGKVPCHVNTGWCFICALGGTLICCEYCPTSFHAECLNIKPPEGSYMCEDCETGRLPLYGEMVWVKLGHYRWWPGIILHPSEIPENILAVKHSPGEFVVRFFGQYDHYWVNRGRVFPFQEGDSGKLSSQKSKIDAAFQMAMEHASRACEILKSATQNEEESIDIASSLLPPHYVKLRANKPCGALCGRRIETQESSLTQCECDPSDELPCGPYSHCLNRMLLTECGPTCRAGDRCNNRAFEKRQYPKLVPYRTPHRGWGLKTLEDIKAGQFVIEYVGELIDEEEFQRRMRRKHEIRDENFYFLTLDKERMIDAGPKGNLARFMNHCCEPNCETQKWTVLGDVRVGLFALYDIPANSEVTFNYNLESAGIEKKRCLCGAKRCSGYIGAKPKQLQSDQSKKIKQVGAKKTYKKRKAEDSPSTSKAKLKPKLGRPPKPKELTDIEKDLLIIKCATNGIYSDSDCSVRLTSIDKEVNSLKRKQIEFTEEPSGSPSKKKVKMNDEKCTDCD